MRYNIYVKTQLRDYNILDLSEEEVQKVVNAYNNGLETFFIGGTKYWINNLFKIEIYTLQHPGIKSADELIRICKERGLFTNSMGDSYLRPDVLSKLGTNVTGQFLKDDFGHLEQQQKEKVMKDPVEVKPLERVFVSHAFKDADVVRVFVEIMEAIGVPSKRIFCTSLKGYGIPFGENFLERIKQELNGNVLVIFMLSENFYNSPISLCEMGATWVRTTAHIPVLIPPFDFKDVKGVIPHTQGFKLTDKGDLNVFKDQLEELMGLDRVSSAIWEEKRDALLKKLSSPDFDLLSFLSGRG